MLMNEIDGLATTLTKVFGISKDNAESVVQVALEQEKNKAYKAMQSTLKDDGNPVNEMDKPIFYLKTMSRIILAYVAGMEQAIKEFNEGANLQEKAKEQKREGRAWDSAGADIGTKNPQ